MCLFPKRKYSIHHALWTQKKQNSEHICLMTQDSRGMGGQKGEESWVPATSSLRKAWKHTDLTRDGPWIPRFTITRQTPQNSQAKRPQRGKLVPSTNCTHLFNPAKPIRVYYVVKSVLLPDAHVVLLLVSTWCQITEGSSLVSSSYLQWTVNA